MSLGSPGQPCTWRIERLKRGAMWDLAGGLFRPGEGEEPHVFKERPFCSPRKGSGQ
jgi:hypothetical protein